MNVYNKIVNYNIISDVQKELGRTELLCQRRTPILQKSRTLKINVLCLRMLPNFALIHIYLSQEQQKVFVMLIMIIIKFN